MHASPREHVTWSWRLPTPSMTDRIHAPESTRRTCPLVTLDPAAAYAGVLPDRADVPYFVTLVIPRMAILEPALA